MSNLMTIKEAAPKLHISEITLRRFIFVGSVPHHRIGKKYFFTDGDIEQYLKRCEVPARPRQEAEVTA